MPQRLRFVGGLFLCIRKPQPEGGRCSCGSGPMLIWIGSDHVRVNRIARARILGECPVLKRHGGFRWTAVAGTCPVHCNCPSSLIVVLYDLQFTRPPPVVFFPVLGRRETALPHMFDAAVCTCAAIVNGAAPAASSVQNKQITPVPPPSVR